MTETTIDVDALANEIRRLGGTSVLGCGALAEALMPFLASHAVDTREAVLEEAAAATEGLRIAWSGAEYFGGFNDGCNAAIAAIRALKPHPQTGVL
jgi:hypothetical protein